RTRRQRISHPNGVRRDRPQPVVAGLNDPREITGTGVVLEEQRLLTNASRVTYAQQLYVEPYQSSNQLTATVDRLEPGIDLASSRSRIRRSGKTGRPCPKPRTCRTARTPSASTAIRSAARRWPSPREPSRGSATAATAWKWACKCSSMPPSTPATTATTPTSSRRRKAHARASALRPGPCQSTGDSWATSCLGCEGNEGR